MLGSRCLNWGSVPCLPPPEPQHFSLPAPVPQWPPGEGFATGKINLGELEVIQITKFQFVWGCGFSTNNWGKGFSFYKPVGIPDGFSCLGYYCQSNRNPLHGFVLVARQTQNSASDDEDIHSQPALSKPVDYVLVWCSDDNSRDLPGYFWLPKPPQGYKSTGFIVTNTSSKPELDLVRCVRADLTDKCESYRLLVETNSTFLGIPLRVWTTRPSHRGMEAKSVSVGTFFCSTLPGGIGENTLFACLKNLDPDCWQAMPNLDQIHALIRHYGPTIFFHPEEEYMPSSVSWFFESGALLYTKSNPTTGEAIASSNLPCGGINDHEYWIDLPSDQRREEIKRGKLDTAEVYAHIKPALGGTFTDIAMWIFYPFNGPATLKLGPINAPLAIGVHVGDWEHLTLRISNFSGHLHSVYLSQHAGGVWVEPWDLEFIQGNRAVVYSSKSGHANFQHPGIYLQGSSKMGIGIRNDCAGSRFYVDCSTRYQVVAAEYLGGEVAEPSWLQYMREWGPIVVRDSRKELDKVIKRFPGVVRGFLTRVLDRLPEELYQEEGPTGPKEKKSWFGDERW